MGEIVKELFFSPLLLHTYLEFYTPGFFRVNYAGRWPIKPLAVRPFGAGSADKYSPHDDVFGKAVSSWPVGLCHRKQKPHQATV